MKKWRKHISRKVAKQKHCDEEHEKSLSTTSLHLFYFFISIQNKVYFREKFLLSPRFPRVRSKHKEGLYRCERISLCVWIFSLFSLLCAGEWRKNPYAFFSSCSGERMGRKRFIFCFYSYTKVLSTENWAFFRFFFLFGWGKNVTEMKRINGWQPALRNWG